MRKRVLALLMVAALVLGACSRAEEAAEDAAEDTDETEVAGVEIERTPAPTPATTEQPTEEPTDDVEEAADVEVVTEVQPAEQQAGTQPTAPAPAGGITGPSPSPAPSPAPAPTPAPRPSPSPSPSPSPQTYETLRAGEGWSHRSAHADEDGWTEASGAPPQRPDGDTDERLFTTLRGEVDEATGDFVGDCVAWLEASSRQGLRADGTVTVDLVVTRPDGSGGSSRSIERVNHTVREELLPGRRSNNLAWPRDPARVPAENGSSLACTVRYTPS